MNERIRELAELAGLAEAADVRVGYIYPAGMEKFAELIVRECCDIVHRKTDESIRVVMAIEQHFGVDKP